MGLANGDLFVSGSILSYQQANRIYRNFRGASVPSALKAGALWSDSDDDRLWHQGTDDLLEVFTEKTILTFENLLSNSGFGVWSQSDAAKGLGSITYDTGAKGAGAAPSVGDAVVGGTSGATAKVISYTTATGTWDAGTATGVVTVGAVTGCFQDNETITFGGVETAAVNGESSIPGTGLYDSMSADRTGEYDVNNCTLTFDTDHYEMDRTAASQVWGFITSGLTSAPGKIYKMEFDVKDGTAAGEDIIIKFGAIWSGRTIYSCTTTAEWVSHSVTIEAIDGEDAFGFHSNFGAGNYEIRRLALYEITPCCTAADVLAFDGWNKDSTLDIYREQDHAGGKTKDGSFYALKLVPSAVADYIKFPGTSFVDSTGAEHYLKYQQRTVTFGAWVMTSKAVHVRFGLYDGAYDYSSYHTGGGGWEWLEVTGLIGASTTDFQVRIIMAKTGEAGGATIVYISQPMLVFGSHIGEGNYQPKPQEIVWLEKRAESLLFDNSGFSDVGWTDHNLEADTDGKIPKGAKAFQARTQIRDAGSIGVQVHINLRADATQAGGVTVRCGGIANDFYTVSIGWQSCGRDGDFQYEVEASGANTLDFSIFYVAVQVN